MVKKVIDAYKQIENENTAFIMLGGSKLYQEQEAALGIKHIIFLPETGDSTIIFKFLNSIDVYAHGRKDGEINSQAMAEAMYFGSPIISHVSTVNNGHIECIGDAGAVLTTVAEYAHELATLQTDSAYYLIKSKQCS